MPRCKGCTEEFRKLAADHCGRCAELVDRPKSRVLCQACGRSFIYLVDTECSDCREEETELSKAGVNHAMAHGVNPRSHSDHGNQYVSPYQRQQIPATPVNRAPKPTADDLRGQAADIQAAMGQGYGGAISRQAQNMSFKVPAKPKMRGVTPVASSSATSIRVMVRTVTNRHNTEKVRAYTPRILVYKEDTPWATVVDDIRVELNAVYQKHYDHRIWTSEEFDLCHFTSKSKIDEDRTEGNIKFLWNQIMKEGKLLSTDKARGSRLIELLAIVDYPQKIRRHHDQDDDFDSLDTSVRRRKRKAERPDLDEDEDERPSKRQGYFTVSGANAYSTVLNVEESSFMVEKTICRISGNGRIGYVTEGAPAVVYVEKEKFANGRTKNAFKMTFSDGSAQYAAKTFYRGQDPLVDVDSGTNLRLLKEELLCLLLAKNCLAKFQSEVKSQSINVYDLTINNTFILSVTTGEHEGLAWIVDPLLSSTDVRKFSGTTQAGNNIEDLVGRTCDAFAHFSLTDSQGTFVLVDIQGILVPLVRNGRRTSAKVLTLFDLMAHSIDKSKGMGDRGLAGIRDFAFQHVCNAICKELRLPDPTASLDHPEDSRHEQLEEKSDNDSNTAVPGLGNYGTSTPSPHSSQHTGDEEATNSGGGEAVATP